jgi:hypothetical protein
VASVAEVKAAIDAALVHVQDGQAAVRVASDRLADARQTLAVAVEGSGHEAVSAARAALTQGASGLEDALSAMYQAVEQAQSDAAAL